MNWVGPSFNRIERKFTPYDDLVIPFEKEISFEDNEDTPG